MPRYPEQGGRASEPPERVGHRRGRGPVVEAGGDRVAVYDRENDEGTPVYVHAKACVVDDVWATVGSDNLNLRSWTHDSELSCAILDDDPRRARPRDPGGLGDGARTFGKSPLRGCMNLVVGVCYLTTSEDGRIRPTLGKEGKP